MNDVAREKLVQAALEGVRQVRGMFEDGRGGLCAMGVLGVKDGANTEEVCVRNGLLYEGDSRQPCIAEGCQRVLMSEPCLITHLNDDHEWDFLTIARKMP